VLHATTSPLDVNGERSDARAHHTEGVVAVVNRIEVELVPLSRWGPALEGVSEIWRGFLGAFPGIALGLLLLLPALVMGRAVTALLRARFKRRQSADIVRELTARAAGLLMFLLGTYLALRVAGLTRLAATVLGGTGIMGLVLGIAFRDIVENVLASILLTRQKPFRKGDLVEIAGIEGYVQRLTVRATVLMNLEGNHVQIPNSTVYKSAIRNYTSNPARRIDFLVGIGYADSIARAQKVALSVIAEHPAVIRSRGFWPNRWRARPSSSGCTCGWTARSTPG
jgi:small-conductance mechanosensitive channel